MCITEFLLLAIIMIGRTESRPSDSKKLLMFFVDGLRWDLVNQENLPGFQTLFASGTRAEHLSPVFPSLCYPNFYSMLTGLYPESHGLIGNNIYDPVAGDSFFSRADPERNAANHWWEGAEPLWVTAKKQKKSSYLYYIAGCDRGINGLKPDLCLKVRNDLTLSHVVESLDHGLDMMQAGKADFVGVYYGEIDTIGHRYGPNSIEMRQKVKELDRVIKFLLHDLWERGLSSTTNLVLVSDHGMTDASIERTINLRRLFDEVDVDRVLESGAYVSIWPKADKVDKIYTQLKSQAHLSVYRKEEIPEAWHYKSSRRVAPITAVADLGWYIETHDFGYLGFGPRKTPAVGMHGYHTEHSDMWGVFAGVGPDIEINRTIPALSVVDVYQVLSHLLDVEPLAHNGTWQHVTPMLRNKSLTSSRHDLAKSFRYEALGIDSKAADSSNSSSLLRSHPTIPLVLLFLLNIIFSSS